MFDAIYEKSVNKKIVTRFDSHAFMDQQGNEVINHFEIKLDTILVTYYTFFFWIMKDSQFRIRLSTSVDRNLK